GEDARGVGAGPLRLSHDRAAGDVSVGRGFYFRLDRVIPFSKLTRDELGGIARRLVGEVLAREGFGQRKCVLNVSNAALGRVIDAGYDPALGARAMKRAVERELTQPAAARLACLNPEELTIVTVRAATEIPGGTGFVLA